MSEQHTIDHLARLMTGFRPEIVDAAIAKYYKDRDLYALVLSDPKGVNAVYEALECYDDNVRDEPDMKPLRATILTIMAQLEEYCK